MKKLYAVALGCSCPEVEGWKIHLFARTAEEAGIIAKRDKTRPCTVCGQCYVWEVVPEEDLVDSIPRNTPAILRWLGLAPLDALVHARANEQYWRESGEQRLKQIETLECEIETLTHDCDGWRAVAKDRRQQIEDLQQENARLKDRILNATLYLDGSRENAERAGEDA